jgi:hypothetical protein
MRPTFACGILGTCESLLVFRADVKGEASFVFWIAVNLLRYASVLRGSPG